MTSAAHLARTALAGAALTGIVTLAAGCASPGPATRPAGGGSSQTPSAPSSGTTSAPATTPPSSGTPPTASGSAPCPTRDLAAKTGLSQGAAGSVYTVLDFTNIGNVTCTLYGYPGVSLGTGTPYKQVGLAATENPTPPRRLVILKPGQVGNALLRIVDAGNFSPSSCGPVTATWLQIYPPNQTTPIYLKYSARTCSKPVHILTVNVVVPGSGGST
jgi:hypothetical protein